jgi:transcriptional regulator NrdR family protein
MHCPSYYFDTKVTDSRVAADGFSIRRRRRMHQCSSVFNCGGERILDLTVIKRDGRRTLQ